MIRTAPRRLRGGGVVPQMTRSMTRAKTICRYVMFVALPAFSLFRPSVNRNWSKKPAIPMMVSKVLYGINSLISICSLLFLFLNLYRYTPYARKRRKRSRSEISLPLHSPMRKHKLEIGVNQDDSSRPDRSHQSEVIDADEGVGALPDDADRGVGDGGSERAEHGADDGEAALGGRGGRLGHQAAARRRGLVWRDQAADGGSVVILIAVCGFRVRDFVGEEEGRPGY